MIQAEPIRIKRLSFPGYFTGTVERENFFSPARTAKYKPELLEAIFAINKGKTLPESEASNVGSCSVGGTEIRP